MAGDWIKMRVDLHAHPKVVRMMSALRADRFRIIGGLHAVWSVFDAHTDDGRLEGYTIEAMDAVIGWPGFSAAMQEVGWLESDGDKALIMPRFDGHNGKSSKRRATETERKRSARSAQDDRNVSANNADKKRTREEKRREENNTPVVPSSGEALSLEIEADESPLPPELDSPEARAELAEWEAYHRTERKKPLKPGQRKNHLDRLKRMCSTPAEVVACLRKARLSGWQAPHELKVGDVEEWVETRRQPKPIQSPSTTSHPEPKWDWKAEFKAAYGNPPPQPWQLFLPETQLEIIALHKQSA